MKEPGDDGYNPWGATLLKDLEMHCGSKFPDELDGLFIDVWSAFFSVAIITIVTKILRKATDKLDKIDRIFIGVFGVLLIVNIVAYIYTLKSYHVFEHPRCSFHLLMALPLTKGFFWTGVALHEFSSTITQVSAVRSRMRKEARAKGEIADIKTTDEEMSGCFGIMFKMGSEVFLLMIGALCVIGAPYVLPLLTTIYIPVTACFILVPAVAYGIVLCCLGCTATYEQKERYGEALADAMMPIFLIYLTVSCIHLSLIYYGNPIDFPDTYSDILKGTLGLFLPSGVKLSVSWGWPSKLIVAPQVCLGFTAASVAASKTKTALTFGQRAAQLSQTALDTAGNAETAAKQAQKVKEVVSNKLHGDEEDPESKSAGEIEVAAKAIEVVSKPPKN